MPEKLNKSAKEDDEKRERARRDEEEGRKWRRGVKKRGSDGKVMFRMSSSTWHLAPREKVSTNMNDELEVPS